MIYSLFLQSWIYSKTIQNSMVLLFKTKEVFYYNNSFGHSGSSQIKK